MMRLSHCVAGAVMATVMGGAPAQAGPAGPAAPVAQRIEATIDRAAEHLFARQHDDGAWRSATYGMYRDGPSLTAHALTALVQAAPDDERTQRGMAYLASLADEDGHIDAPLIMPVYTASQAAQVFIAAGRPEDARPWLALLLAHQMTEGRGWSPDDLQYGGWGYSAHVPHRPDSAERATHVDANLSATVFALSALRLADEAGVMAVEREVFERAMTFVERCHNPVDLIARRQRAGHDGGFIFTPVDAVRNKAGRTDEGPGNQQRFHSYGSTTADGLRACLAVGTGPSERQTAQAAAQWLLARFDATTVPGTFNADREVLRDAYYFYYAWSVSLALRQYEGIDVAGSTLADWPTALAEALLERQADDGAWRNRFTDAKEDDPLVATPFAMLALSTCRASLERAPEPSRR